jgi:hypothetical protein
MDSSKNDRPTEYLSRHYDDLPESPGAIRILKLRPSTYENEQIDCTLIIPKLDDEGKTILPQRYEALSWSWGKAEKSKYIRIAKGPENHEQTFAKAVTPNLFSALRALRHPTHSRYLWIDAICIDQDDPNERNHQVEQMDEIYGNAYSVCIWLGEATESSKIAIDFIKDEVMKLQNFDQLTRGQEASKKWFALLDLMQRDWFSRRWVVQEIALARRALIYCGRDKLSWSKFAVAVELFVEVETATHRLSEVMRQDKKTNFVPLLFEYVGELGASLLVDATGKLYPDYRVEEQDEEDDFPLKIEQTADGDELSDTEDLDVEQRAISKPDEKTQQTPLLSLEYLVSSLAVFDVTVPHDTIYAMLAISKDTTPKAQISTHKTPNQAHETLEMFMQRKHYNVDYKLPYVDVCKDFIKFCITQSLTSDKSRALDVICRPWATEEKTLKAIDAAQSRSREIKKREIRKKKRDEEARRRRHKGKNSSKLQRPIEHENSEESDAEELQYVSLPSWIPQLSNASHGMFSQPGINGTKMSRSNADPLVGLPSTTQKNYAAAETKGVDLKSLKFRKRLEVGHYSMYVRGFVLDTVERTSELSRNGQIPEDWPEMANWTVSGGRDPNREKDREPPDEFWRTLVANRGKDGKSPPVYYARACKESFSKGGYRGGAVDTTGLISYERNSVVAQFCRRVQAVTWNRAMVKTKLGRLGLVGKNIRKGDLVCILYGCSVPVILRKSERKLEEEFDKEMEWEIEFLTDTLKNYVDHWQKRVRGHRKRKEIAKRKFFAWEVGECKKWLEKNIADSEKKTWIQKLDEQWTTAVELDAEIDSKLKDLEEAEKDYEEEKARTAKKLAKMTKTAYETRKTELKNAMIKSKKCADQTLQECKRKKEAYRERELTQEWYGLVGWEGAPPNNTSSPPKALEEMGSSGPDEENPDPILEQIGRYSTALNEQAKRVEFWTLYRERIRDLESASNIALEQYEHARSSYYLGAEVAEARRKVFEARTSYEEKRAERLFYVRAFHMLPEPKLNDATDEIGSDVKEKMAFRLFNKFKQEQVKKEIKRAREENAKREKAKREKTKPAESADPSVEEMKKTTKVEKTKSAVDSTEVKAKTTKAIPDVDWQSFELSLKYGRLWLRRFVKYRKARSRKIMDSHTKSMESKLYKLKKDRVSVPSEGIQSSLEIALPLQHRYWAWAMDWKVGKIVLPYLTKEESASNRCTLPQGHMNSDDRTAGSRKGPDSSILDDHRVTAANSATKGKGMDGENINGNKNTKPMRERAKAEGHKKIGKMGKREETNGDQTNIQKPEEDKVEEDHRSEDKTDGGKTNKVKKYEHTIDEDKIQEDRILDLFHDDLDETDWENEEWRKKTTELYKELGKLEQTQPQEDGNTTTSKDEWTEEQWKGHFSHKSKIQKSKEEKKDDWKDENWTLYMERLEAKQKKSRVERMGTALDYPGKILDAKGRFRRLLTEEAANKYDKKIRKNFKKKSNEDGFWSYKFMGECYIHGMMDGEAMAFQNGDDEDDTLPSTVFELR